MKAGREVAIIGAGPAGLTAAYLLSKQGCAVQVLESDPEYVGGISRTVRYNGCHFDIGGHRFFSKSQRVEDFWTEILPQDLLDRPRSSRILYRGKFFSYPLKAFEALFKLGVLESILCVISYFKARLFPVKDPRTFEDWVTHQFGKRLFRIFFKTYTEKVWGIPCQEISADWAAQRIKGLSLFSAVLHALRPRFLDQWGRTGGGKKKGAVIKTLIDTFRYPRKGPGMLWEACAEKIRGQGGQIHMGQEVTSLHFSSESNQWIVRYRSKMDGTVREIVADEVVSSAPIRELVAGITPALPAEAQGAAKALKYRDFLMVALIIRGEDVFPDNWIYIHDPSVLVGRIQNFKSWSPEMISTPGHACYGLEYFCFKDDELWSMEDSKLIALAKEEIGRLGLLNPAHVVDGCVVRQPKAYPVYDDDYAQHVAIIRKEIETRFPSLHLVGRNGMHKYNNQDHAIMTAMLTVENILAGKRLHDVWAVNQDAEYHESGSAGQDGASGLRQVPQRVFQMSPGNAQEQKRRSA